MKVNKYHRINLRKYAIIIALGIPLFLYVIIFSNKQDKQYAQLEKNGVVDTALIVRSFIGAKHKKYFEYQFKVKDQILNGFQQYSPSNGELKIGDLVLIEYLPSNPDEINRIIKKSNKKIIKIEKPSS